MRNFGSVAAFAAATVLLAACDVNKVTAMVRVELESPTPEEAATCAAVLQRRFADLLPGYFSKVTATPAGEGVNLVFTGQPPADEQIRTYASTQGIFRMYPVDQPNYLLVTDLDVEQVSTSMGQGGPAIDLVLNERAGNRLETYTRQNVGKLLATSWDRKEEMRASIQGVFGRRFQTTGVDADTARLRQIMLSSGRLPIAVRRVDIRHPTGAQ